MSYERDTRASGTGRGPSRTSQPIAPGKATLTEGLTGGIVQRKALQGGEPGSAPSIGAATLTPGPAPQPGVRDVIPAGSAADLGIAAPGSSEGAPGIARPGGGATDIAKPGDGTDAGISNPDAGNVAATVVGSGADTEAVPDGSFTPALLAALHANPGLSIDEVLLQLSAAALGDGTDSGGLHHPTIVQYGQAAQGTPEAGDPRKRAILIANQNYLHIGRLYKPIAEADAMKTELESRGYDANVHSDRSAVDMTSLWGSLVGSANRGDDLVAFYGGHGAPEGLIGINHDYPPNPQDIFTNAQVSGVVSSATSKGAHIRFVMDSCHAGAAVQTIREERHNELAAVATSTGDQLRIAAMAGLRQAKERLLALCGLRKTMPEQIDRAIQQHQAGAPDPANTAATRAWNQKLTKLRDFLGAVERSSNHAADRLWAEYVPLLDIVKTAAGHRVPPPPITDYGTLGAQVNYLDDLWNAVSQPMERAIAKAGGA